MQCCWAQVCSFFFNFYLFTNIYNTTYRFIVIYDCATSQWTQRGLVADEQAQWCDGMFIFVYIYLFTNIYNTTYRFIVIYDCTTSPWRWTRRRIMADKRAQWCVVGPRYQMCVLFYLYLSFTNIYNLNTTYRFFIIYDNATRWTRRRVDSRLVGPTMRHRCLGPVCTMYLVYNKF
jgi:hypothetical protein